MERSETGIAGLGVENMPDEEVEQLIERAQAILAQRVQTRIDQLRPAARRAGFEVLVSRIGVEDGRRRSRGAPAPGRKPVAARYRNRDNPAQTWSGRGREPKWLAEKIAAGASREEFAIAG